VLDLKLAYKNFHVNLVIDRGNTHLKFGIFDQCKLVASDSINFLDERKMKEIVKQYGITKAIISSVVEESNQTLVDHLKENINFALELSHSTPLPFTWNYKSKETIGKDRLAAVAGAIDLFPNHNLLVFDAGTAITYEIINNQHEFLGGNISPGMQMRFKALNTFTSQLPLLTASRQCPLIGNSTEEAIRAGVQNSITFEIDGLIHHFQEQNQDLKTVITGGDAEFFARKVKNPIFVAPNLVLIGLNRILDYNAQ
jgi:type III pantothenate kinase